jgi:hypothetical protein
MSDGDGVFFLAAQSVYRGLKFFDDAAARFEVVSDPGHRLPDRPRAPREEQPPAPGHPGRRLRLGQFSEEDPAMTPGVPKAGIRTRLPRHR